MSKTLKHETKADALIEKGMMLLWSKGYNATSVNDIVKAAEVPKGSFYFYFDSKEDFAVKSIEKYFSTQFPPSLERLQNKSVSPKQRLLDFYEYRTRVIKDEFDCKMGCMGCNLVNEMAEHSEAIRNAVQTKTDMVKSYITEVVEEAQDFGEISNTLNARDLVEFMEDAARGAMVSMKEMDSSYPIDNAMNMLSHIILK
ncbi:TetR/AcrR family transcriptional regulator [Aquimarina sp. 2201CG5-10]|uniref:TetR/AcrR family transcriptional regulator n=1 Tax=Aquimarina callyspongiae TaxID=3098150 RepID=UPI002AB4257A|nr:TetR/AcrR family transcriptional regulator [Aquimarina sp. 2201CG5-10]MDY8134359.1 TetR/AcrR family transcriptional regulator [Aquimarina sp. 2201CG5-10]